MLDPALPALVEHQTVFETPFAPWILVVLGLLGLATLALAWRNLRGTTAARRATLFGLRTAMVVLAVLLLGEPALREQEVTRLPNVVPVLVDASVSMSLAAGPGAASREAAVSEWLRRQLPNLAEEGGEHHYRFFTFGEALAPSGSEPLLQGGWASQGTTLTLEALEEAQRRSGAQELGGFVLLSDGADHGALRDRVPRDAPPPRDLQERVAALGAPVHALLVGRLDGLVDLALRRVIHDEFAFVHNVLGVEVEVEALGAPAGPLMVQLEEDGLPLQSRELQVVEGQSRYRVSFSFTPATVGRHHYRLRLPRLQGETVLQNNERDFVIRVLRDRVRVLQVAGQPSWDERFLREYLKKSPNVDLISFFILRTGSDLASVPSNELSLIPFPVEELFEKELGSFDLVILQNFDYRPYRMRRYLPRIRDYVLRGGALAVLGGAQAFSAGGYAGSEVEEVLPVRLPPPGPDETLFAFGSSRARLSEAGLRHPMLALSPLPSENERVWATLPPLEGLNRISGLAPGAVVLASAALEGQQLPLLVASQPGRGRSLSILTDSLWRWTLPAAANGGDARSYPRFWDNAIRWLIRDPDQELLQIATDRERYAPGDAVRCEVKLFDRGYGPAQGVSVRLERRHLQGESAPAPGAPLGEDELLVTDGEGRALWSFPAGGSGVWRVRASAQVEGMEREAETIYLVGQAEGELQDVAPRRDLLRSLAELSQGSLRDTSVDLGALPLRPARVLRVQRQESHPLWTHPAVLALALLLLGLEWGLRVRWGLL